MSHLSSRMIGSTRLITCHQGEGGLQRRTERRVDHFCVRVHGGQSREERLHHWKYRGYEAGQVVAWKIWRRAERE
jgi:hypothetical protein